MATVLVTGGNRGIGLALAQRYAERGDRVYITSRDPGIPLPEGVHGVLPLDVRDQSSIDALARRLEGERLDVLLNNAGVLERNTLEALNLDSIRFQFEVNALGPLRVTSALRGCLGQGSKVGIVTSRMGSVADNTSGSHYGYRMSKAAVNMAGKSLAVDLAPEGVALRLLHPGYVKTGMTGFRGNWGPDEASKGLVACMDALTLAKTGEFWHASGEPLPW